jgi:hypothetical protein
MKENIKTLNTSLVNAGLFRPTFYLINVYLDVGESNGKLPLRTCLECSVPEPYRSPDWALIPAQRLNTNDDDLDVCAV